MANRLAPSPLTSNDLERSRISHRHVFLMGEIRKRFMQTPLINCASDSAFADYGALQIVLTYLLLTFYRRGNISSIQQAHAADALRRML